jgi:hypothetical protein
MAIGAESGDGDEQRAVTDPARVVLDAFDPAAGFATHKGGIVERIEERAKRLFF